MLCAEKVYDVSTEALAPPAFFWNVVLVDPLVLLVGYEWTKVVLKGVVSKGRVDVPVFSALEFLDENV